MGVSHSKGPLKWAPYNKDPTTWGTISGAPILRNPHMGIPGNLAGLMFLPTVAAAVPAQ